MSNDFAAILDRYHFEVLRDMASDAGLLEKGSKKLLKRALIAKMEAEFFTKTRVLASFEKLNERERAVFNRILLRAGKIPTRSLQREVLRAGLATKSEKPKQGQGYYNPSLGGYEYRGDPSRPTSTAFEDIMARLTYHGLVFGESGASGPAWDNSATKLDFHPPLLIFVPQVIRDYLPPPGPAQILAPDYVPHDTKTEDPALLLRDLYLYWDFVRRNEVTMIQSGLVGKRWLKAINENLLVPDPLLEKIKREDETDRLYLLRQILQSLNLIWTDTAFHLKLTSKDPLKLPKFWGQPLPAQLEACVKGWSLSDEPENLDKEANRYRSTFANARQLMLQNLTKLVGSDAWIRSDDFADQLSAQELDFLFPDHSRILNHPNSWFHGDMGDTYYSGGTQALLALLEEAEHGFVRKSLAGFFLRLGLVELGYSNAPAKGNNWQAFRLTPSGRAILSGTSMPPAHTDGGKLIIQPNFQILAIGPVSLALLAELDLFADRERADRGAFEYRLSRESIYRAQQQGYMVNNVLAFLAQAGGGGDLPQNVRRSLEEWAAHHERIVFRTGVSLLQAVNAQLLTKLLHEPETSQLLARPLTPEIALLKPQQQKKLAAALARQGILPVTSGATSEAAEQSITLDDEGLVSFVRRVPSLHVWGRLVRLAAETAEGQWRLSPALLGQAGGGRAQSLALLEELQKLHRGPLPEKLLERIKIWTGYYAGAAIETLTLIEFDDQATLAELQQRPDLRALLTPFPAGERALAVVPAAQLPHVKDILVRLGVNLRDGLS
jgi:hypothetical protein